MTWNGKRLMQIALATPAHQMPLMPRYIQSLFSQQLRFPLGASAKCKPTVQMQFILMQIQHVQPSHTKGNNTNWQPQRNALTPSLPGTPKAQHFEVVGACCVLFAVTSVYVHLHTFAASATPAANLGLLCAEGDVARFSADIRKWTTTG